ncbi:MAG: endolytic transglycosylase MltG [Patescibacteria group bacterium]
MDFFKRYLLWLCSFAVAIILVVGYTIVFAPPQDFPSDSIVVIVRGASVSEISEQLSDAKVIKYPSILNLILQISGTSSRVQSGAYLFKMPQNLLAVAYRLITGDYKLPPIRITFPEGVTVRDIALKTAEAFPDISAEEFLSYGRQQEGYLFPDTYLFPVSADAKTIISTMRENFNTKIESLSDDVQASGHSLSDIVIIASLVEKEVRTNENKRIVAGILWTRLERGMPLQVDAVFGYIFNRDTYSPSFEDLKVDSPYNTYIHIGLPPGPISNPGLESIQAALHPTKTNYLYYLTGSDNLMHYARTYAEHMANQTKYLR